MEQGKIKRSGIFFDTEPIENSVNGVLSGGVYDMIKNQSETDIEELKEEVNKLKEHINLLSLMYDFSKEIDTGRRTQFGKIIYRRSGFYANLGSGSQTLITLPENVTVMDAFARGETSGNVVRFFYGYNSNEERSCLTYNNTTRILTKLGNSAYTNFFYWIDYIYNVED